MGKVSKLPPHKTGVFKEKNIMSFCYTGSIHRTRKEPGRINPTPTSTDGPALVKTGDACPTVTYLGQTQDLPLHIGF